MSTLNRKELRRKVHRRIRKKISGTAERPRLAVHFSNKNVYAQVIDDLTGKTLASLVEERTHAFPCSGEINRTVVDASALIAQVESRYSAGAEVVEHLDGLSVSFKDWRFNLRMSNTEPVVRLNGESRGDVTLMAEKTQELLAIIDAACAVCERRLGLSRSPIASFDL